MIWIESFFGKRLLSRAYIWGDRCMRKIIGLLILATLVFSVGGCDVKKSEENISTSESSAVSERVRDIEKEKWIDAFYSYVEEKMWW